MSYFRIAESFRGSAVAKPLLRVEALSKTFGGIAAIGNLSFVIRADEIVGLIGPKRSDRSTIVDLLAGKIKPNSGSIKIAGEDVSQLGCEARLRHGVVRGPQLANLFQDLTALENVLLGGGARLPPLFPRRGGRTYRDEAVAALDLAGLADMSDVRVADMSLCEQRFLTIAIAIRSKPSLLLLDSPAAGMTKAERVSLGSVLSNTRDTGISILITEPAMGPLTQICDRVLVLSSGRIIADDAPAMIAGNAAVLEAYISRTQ